MFFNFLLLSVVSDQVKIGGIFFKKKIFIVSFRKPFCRVNLKSLAVTLKPYSYMICSYKRNKKVLNMVLFFWTPHSVFYFFPSLTLTVYCFVCCCFNTSMKLWDWLFFNKFFNQFFKRYRYGKYHNTLRLKSQFNISFDGSPSKLTNLLCRFEKVFSDNKTNKWINK